MIEEAPAGGARLWRRGLLVALLLAAAGGAWWFVREAEETPATTPPPRLVPPRPASAPADPAIRATNPAPSAEIAPETRPTTAKPLHLVVRRLYDGAPVPGVGMRPAAAASSRSDAPLSTADEEGRLQVPATAAAAMVPEGDRWRMAKQTLEEIAASGTVWVYDTVRIRIEVELQPEGVSKAYETVSVCATLPLPDRGGDPWTTTWLRVHKVFSDSIDGKPVAGKPGLFTADVPRLPRVTVIAGKEGWRPANAAVEVSADAAELAARLTLTPGLAISGVLRDEQGKPVANAAIDAFVVRWFPWDRSRDHEINAEMAQKFSPNGGVSMATTKEGTLLVRIRERAVTDSLGRFTVHTKSEGRIGLYVYESGRGGARADLGEVRDDVSGLELTVPSVPGGPFVTVLEGGSPLEEREFACSDCTDPLRPSTVMRTDRQGRIPADWFQKGHLYHVRIPRLSGNGGFLRWEQQESFDLATLPKDWAEDF